MINFHSNPIIVKQFNNQIPKPGKTGLDWFLFCYFLNQFNKGPVLEIGAGNGGSLYSMLAMAKDVTIVDSWDQGWTKEYVKNILTDLGCTVKFIDTYSTELDTNQLPTYNFIHLDANKSLRGTLNDLELSARLCSGVICVDDYMNSMWPEVTWAVDQFVKENPTWKRVLIGNHQIFLSQKKLNLEELVADFPLIYREGSFYMTYGMFPKFTDAFVKHGKMCYTWHTISTSQDTINF